MNDVYMIALAGKDFPKYSIVDGHIVVCKDNGRQLEFFKGRNLALYQAQEILEDISSQLTKIGYDDDDFAIINDYFLIDMNKAFKMRLAPNIFGLHQVVAEFKNGQFETLYMGSDEQHAINLISDFERRKAKHQQKRQSFLKKYSEPTTPESNTSNSEPCAE